MWEIIYYVVMAILVVYSYIQARKAQKTSLTAGTLEATTSDEGGSITVIFGTCDVAPNVAAFEAGTPEAIKKKKQTIGYKYFASAHLILCHGPVDNVSKIKFSAKTAMNTTISENAAVLIDKTNLFGGNEQSGGIYGYFFFLFGQPDQAKHPAFTRIFGDVLQSAWRGVLSVILEDVYIGTSPTMPDSKWRVQRIHTLQNGETQWYDEKAEIFRYGDQVDADGYFLYHVQDGFTNLSQLSEYAGLDYVDDLWISAQGPFGTISTAPLAVPNTAVASAAGRAIMIRHYLIVDDNTDYGDISVNFDHDDGAVLYFNGVQIDFETTGYYNSTATISEDLIKTGTNVLFVAAVDCIPAGSTGGIYLSLSFSIKTKSYRDLNAAHIIRECLTNTLWGKGATTAQIDDQSFRSAANTLYDEGLGLSLAWSESKTIKDFISNVLDHINGELYVDRVSNLWTLKLIRDDYDKHTLDVLTESHYRSLGFERRTLADCINQVSVTYYDSGREKDSTLTVQDIGRIAQQGGVSSQDIDYKGVSNNDLASVLALRDLKTLSTELASIEFETTEAVAGLWNKGHPFKLSNTCYGLSEAIFRVTEIKFGDGVDNTISVKAVEDSFSNPMTAVIEYTPITRVNKSAQDATAIAFEVPYIELVEQYGQFEIDQKLSANPDLSFVGMAAVRPNNYHINASLYSNAGAGYAEEGTLDFCPSATLKSAIGYLDTAFEVANVAEFNLLKVNDRIQLDDELMAFVSFDTTTHILTVKRGVFDTTVQKHSAAARLYGWDNYSGLDSTEYLSGETVALKALTLTGSDILELSEATAHSITCSARAIRPYPPANVQINGEYFPAEVTGALILTWAHRNRMVQTSAVPLAWTAASSNVEDGVEYLLTLIGIDDQKTVLLDAESLGNVASHELDMTAYDHANYRVQLQSVRDQHTCLQIFEHTFAYASYFSAPYNLTAEYTD